jgi:sulfide:quinone oxidoreductase
VATRASAKVVVLGGGSGGIVAATKLGDAIGRDHAVTLIDRRPRHVFQSSYLWMATGKREPDDITRSLRAVEKRGVRFVQDDVVHIDTDRKLVTTAGGEFPYDKLVVSLGYETHPGDIPGDHADVHQTWELEPALRFREALRAFRGGRLVVGVAAPPYRCPPGPYEAAWLFEDYLRQRGARDATEIAFFTPEPGPVGGSGKPSEFIREHLVRRGIALHADFALAGVDAAAKVVRAVDGRELPYDLLMVVPPHRPSKVLYDSGMVDSPAGIEVEYDTLATRWDGVHAVGDNANLPASKAGVVAHTAAEVVAHNIAHELTGKGHNERLRLHTI